MKSLFLKIKYPEKFISAETDKLSFSILKEKEIPNLRRVYV